jgi:hypothetical protein
MCVAESGSLSCLKDVAGSSNSMMHVRQQAQESEFKAKKTESARRKDTEIAAGVNEGARCLLRE